MNLNQYSHSLDFMKNVCKTYKNLGSNSVKCFAQICYLVLVLHTGLVCNNTDFVDVHNLNCPCYVLGLV